MGRLLGRRRRRTLTSLISCNLGKRHLYSVRKTNKDDRRFKSVKQLPSSTSWESILPDELWQKIFSGVVNGGNQRRLEPVSLVCKRFLSLSNNVLTSVTLSPSKACETLYSRFRFINTIKFSKAYPNLDAAITQLAHSNLRLQSLYLSEQTQFPKEAMRLLGQSKGRTMTSLSCVRFDNFGDADVEIVADCFQYLQKLDIQGDYDGGGQVTDEGILVISIKLNCLVSLNIRGNENLSDRALEYLSSNSLLLGELTVEFFEKFPVGLDKVCSFSSLFSLNHPRCGYLRKNTGYTVES